MTLTLDTHYKYESTYRYYYLTLEGAELLTGIDSLGSVWKDADRRLKSQGKLMKTVISYTKNNDYDTYTRQDIVEYKLYKNEDNELDDLLFMLGEMAEWAYDTNGDRIAYEERNPMDMINLLPITIRQKGRESGLIFFGKCTEIIPEDEYKVGY